MSLATPTPINRLHANDSYVFLMKQLEKVDEKILEPLAGTDWPRDIPVITGGGLMESIATIDVTYASSGRAEDSLIFDSANDIPVMQADMSKSVARTFNFAEYMSFSTLEKEKMRQVGMDPETFLNKGIRLHCDKTIDQNVYKGFPKIGSTGLLNSAGIARISAGSSAASSTKWEDKTADEILEDINTILYQVWQSCDCSSDALPNHILIPVEQFGMLVSRKVGRRRQVHPELCTGEQSDSSAGWTADHLSLQMVQRDRLQCRGPHGRLYEPGRPDLLQPDPATPPYGDRVREYAHQDPLYLPVLGSTVPVSYDCEIYGWHLSVGAQRPLSKRLPLFDKGSCHVVTEGIEKQTSTPYLTLLSIHNLPVSALVGTYTKDDV